jgi:hypothetical protein
MLAHKPRVWIEEASMEWIHSQKSFLDQELLIPGAALQTAN